jgi:hypothetical protein
LHENFLEKIVENLSPVEEQEDDNNKSKIREIVSKKLYFEKEEACFFVARSDLSDKIVINLWE